MKVFNIEVFDPGFNLRSSYQTSNTNKYEYDYLSISNSTVEIPNIIAEKNDYVRIYSSDISFTGIVVNCTEKDGKYILEYKPMLSLMNVNVLTNKETLKSVSLEQWIATFIENTYVNNPDEYQNLKGFSVTYTSSTYDALFTISNTVENLYELIKKAFTLYGIVVDFSICVENKTIVANVHPITETKIVIEADLPNIISSNFVMGKNSNSYNKVTIYNSEDISQSETFYLLSDGTITNNPEDELRITPVVFEIEEVSANDSSSFYDAAYESAFNKLEPEKYSNLIEIEVCMDDSLLNPLSIRIGQRVEIIKKEKSYNSILTGIKYTNTITFMFGLVRLELTKRMKRRT